MVASLLNFVLKLSLNLEFAAIRLKERDVAQR